eukprot:7615608-Alexandrium_andersonii.AAC.1
MRSARRSAATGVPTATVGVTRSQYCESPVPRSAHSPARPCGGVGSAGSKRTGPSLASASAS